MLRSVLPLSANKDFVQTFSRFATEQTICAVCGLEKMGHAPESKWLGHDQHSYAAKPATEQDIKRARELTTLAYSQRT